MNLPDTNRLKRGRAAIIDCRDLSCRACVSACGFSAISIADGRPYSDPDKCVGCGGCAGICPTGSVRLVKDRGDGSFELTVSLKGDVPEVGDIITVDSLVDGKEIEARVTQALPKRPGNEYFSVRATADSI